MSRPKQIETLLRHAQQQEQKAQASWLQARHKVLAAQNQLTELQGYAQDYSLGRLQGEVSPSGLINQHQFADRLRQAVMQQSQVLHAARAEQDQHHNDWQEQRRQLEALRQMQQRRQQQAAQAGQRLEQRRLDELTGTRAAILLGASHA